MSADGEVIAAGTKTGAIYWLLAQQGPASADSAHEERPANCPAAPVLALTFLDGRTIAASDTADRCLLWQYGQPEPVGNLPTGQRRICGLFHLACGHVAGLTGSGELLRWDWSRGVIVERLQIPALPDVCALVRPVYWRAADLWVWPGRDGVIVFYQWQDHKVSVTQAHEGDAYAMAVCNDELLTIGRLDGGLNRWCAGTDEPIGSVDAPKGVISAASWPRKGATAVVLVDDSGRAGAYSWNDGKLDLIEWLPGGGHRIAVSPDLETYQAELRRHEVLQAKELALDIRGKIARRELDELELLYQQLIDLGYAQLALALRAEQARGNNDLIGELKAYTELAGVIPADQPGSQDWLLRYARLLERVWQLRKARAVYERLLRVDPDNRDYADTLQRLSRYVGIADKSGCVVETDIPIATLVKSAMVVEERFTGRYVLNNIGAPISCSVVIAASELIGRYEHITRERPQMPLPSAEQMELWWLSREQAYQVTTVVFKAEDPDPLSRVELGIKLFNVRLQTVLAPVVMFNACDKAEEATPEQHNKAILEELHGIEEHSPAKGWLEAVYRSARQAIRQVMTRALAEGV
jgi:tetratricopeptide (TPR) repeat protein